jgi:NADH:ubiquinone oxidoreductase subunit 6 (subunit J)
MRLVIAGIVLVVLLGVVAFVARGHTSPAGNGAHDRGASQAVANAVFTAWILVMVAGALFIAYMLSIKKRDTKRDEFRIKPLLVSLLFLAAVVIGMVVAYNHLGHKNPGARPIPVKIGTSGGKGDKAKLQKAINPHSPAFNWELAAGIFALIFGVSATALVASKRKRSKLVRELTVAHELLAMLDETLDDLRNEADPRKAVIAAYARMEKILSAHDLARHPSEAPIEYLTRVLVDLRVTEAAVSKLTALFERAKFSEHDIDAEAKEQAIAALISLRDDLRVIDSPEDKRTLSRDELPTSTPA